MQNLGDLKAAIVDGMFGRADIEPVAQKFVDLCHADLNLVLRTRRQLTSQTLVLDADGKTPLPDDYLQYREVVALLNPVRVLEYVVPTYGDWAYPYDFADLPRVFTIDGPSIVVRPKTTADIRFEYWAQIPAMVQETDTNWLMQKHPGIYLYGALKHANIDIDNETRALKMAALQSSLIDAVTNDDRLAMYSKARAHISRRGP